VKKPSRTTPAGTIPTPKVISDTGTATFHIEATAFGYVYLAGALRAIANLPQQDPTRKTKITEAIQKFRDTAPQAWHTNREGVICGLTEGYPEPFFHVVQDYGPRGLAFMLADKEILKRIEGWWVESIQGNRVSHQNMARIGKELGRAGSKGRKRQYLPEEAKQNKKEQDKEAKQRFRARRKKK
jgi:hypothetical protein